VKLRRTPHAIAVTIALLALAIVAPAVFEALMLAVGSVTTAVAVVIYWHFA
jgi:hypothetical protein